MSRHTIRANVRVSVKLLADGTTVMIADTSTNDRQWSTLWSWHSEALLNVGRISIGGPCSVIVDVTNMITADKLHIVVGSSNVEFAGAANVRCLDVEAHLGATISNFSALAASDTLKIVASEASKVSYVESTTSPEEDVATRGVGVVEMLAEDVSDIAFHGAASSVAVTVCKHSHVTATMTARHHDLRAKLCTHHSGSVGFFVRGRDGLQTNIDTSASTSGYITIAAPDNTTIENLHDNDDVRVITSRVWACC